MVLVFDRKLAAITSQVGS